MNPKESSEVTVETLLALRHEPDALRLIAEKLHVKAMGPADHIRTKHEVKAFVETGDFNVAEQLLKRAVERRAASQTQGVIEKMSVKHSLRIDQ
jgi:hypothetical protein